MKFIDKNDVVLDYKHIDDLACMAEGLYCENTNLWGLVVYSDKYHYIIMNDNQNETSRKDFIRIKVKK